MTVRPFTAIFSRLLRPRAGAGREASPGATMASAGPSGPRTQGARIAALFGRLRTQARVVSAAVIVVAGAVFLPATAQASFGIASFDGGAFDSLGNPVTQAGSHPDAASAKIVFNTRPAPPGYPPEVTAVPAEDVKDVVAVLPPGLIGNPTAVPTCSILDFSKPSAPCPSESQLGVAHNVVADLGTDWSSPVYNLQPDFGEAAKFGFNAGVQIVLHASLSPHPPYNAIIRAANVTQAKLLFSTAFSAWGVPADHGTGAPALPFLSLPTSCNGPIETDVNIDSWQGSTDSASFLSHDNLSAPPLGDRRLQRPRL